MRRSAFFMSLILIGVTLAAPPPLFNKALSRFLTDTKFNVTNRLPLISISSSAPNVVVGAPSNNTLRSDDEKTFAVPASEITLRVRWWNDRPINYERLGAYLQEIQMEVMEHIAKNRDSSLSKLDDDPYRRRGIGFYAIFSSTPSPSHPEQHLTYKFLFEALEGLYDVMFIDNHPDGSYTTITHENFGVLGTAVVLPNDPASYHVAAA